MSERTRPWPAGAWTAALPLIALPLVAHLAFSPLGFNPTDDGFILAIARRLLEGEVPHRDFISIRPVGSSLLHAPWILVGGDLTFWLGRLAAWLEFGLIAWGWTRIAQGRGPASPLSTLAIAVTAFALSSHTFPIMPWHTVDGLALVTLGVWLARSPVAGKRALGYALVGAAVLCKQNFLPAAPAAVLLLGDARRPWAWAAAAAPALLYAAYVAGAGAGPHAWEQLASLGAQGYLVPTGVVQYLTLPSLYAAAALGAAAAWLAARTRGRGPKVRPSRWAVAGFALVLLLVLAAGVAMNWEGLRFTRESFLLFGALAGAAAVRAATGGWRGERVRVAALALVTAWASSLSLGYNSPALAAGPLAACLLSGVLAGRPGDEAGPGRAPGAAPGARTIALALLAAAVVAVWIPARRTHVYRDAPAAGLIRPLDDVLRGGRLLRTNLRTHELMSDLNRAVEQAGGSPFAIVVDFAAFWVRAPQRNPLPIDWPQSFELNTPRLFERVIAALEAGRGTRVVIVQKVYAEHAARAFYALPDEDPYYAIAAHVRRNHRKIGETRLFDLYR